MTVKLKYRFFDHQAWEEYKEFSKEGYISLENFGTSLYNFLKSQNISCHKGFAKSSEKSLTSKSLYFCASTTSHS